MRMEQIRPDRPIISHALFSRTVSFFHLKMAQFSDKTIIKSLLVLVDRLSKSDMVSSFKL